MPPKYPSCRLNVGEHQGFTQKSELILIKLNGKPILITQFNFGPEIKMGENLTIH